MNNQQPTNREDNRQRHREERRQRERARRGAGEKSDDNTRQTVKRQTSGEEREVIRNSWGYVYDLDGELPRFYLTDEKGTFWLNRKGQIYKKNNAPIFDHILNDKLFKLKQEKVEDKDEILTIEPIELGDIFVNGSLLTKKLVIKNGQCDITSKTFPNRLKFEAFFDTTTHPELSCIGPNYRFINLLGRGGFAYVFKGFSVTEETFCAIKTARFDYRDPELTRENFILSKVEHMNIIKVLAFVEVERAQFFITELATGGSLEYRIKKSGEKEITEVFAKRIFTQLFSAFSYLHLKKILHRDLKPANIVLSKPDDATCVARVIDFGLACFSTDADQSKYIVGSIEFMSPEILTKKLRRSATMQYTEKVDVWGLGVCLFEALNKCLPFHYDEDLKKYRQTMMLGRENFISLESFKNLSKGTRFILESCLHINERKRPAIVLLMKYPWVITTPPPAYSGNI